MEQPRKNIIDQLSVFVHRKWLFIVPLALGTIAGLAASFEITEKFISSTLILVEEQQVPEEYVTPTDRTPFSHRLNVISQQILSRTRLEHIIKEFKLYGDRGPSRFARALAFITGKDGDERTPEDIIEQMRGDIQFMVMGETGPGKQHPSGGNAFTITYMGSDPQTTMQVTDTLASLFIEENLLVREQYAEGTSEFISIELDKSLQELSIFEQKIKDFKEANAGMLPEQLEANLRALDRLQLELQDVSAARRGDEDRRMVLEEQLKYAPAGAVPPVVQSSLSSELQNARAQLGVLLSSFKETYPDVIIMRKKIRDLEGRLGARPGPSGAGPGKMTKPSEVMNPAYPELMAVKSRIATLRERDPEIRKGIAMYQRRVELTPAVEQQQTGLMRDYQVSLENYQALLGKKMNARLSENLEKRQQGARFRVVDPANLPDRPEYPNKPLVTAVGLLGGGAFGAGLVFLFEFLNPAFRKPEDFEGIIDSPVLSSIPLFPADGGKGDASVKVKKERTASA